MLLVLKDKIQKEEIDKLILKLQWMGFSVRISSRKGKAALAVVKGTEIPIEWQEFAKLPHVEEVIEFAHPFKLAAREFSEKPTEIHIKGRIIGGDFLTLMVGPCSIESKEQIEECAQIVANEGVSFLRGGAFKPRTSPYSFQGLGERGLRYQKEAAEKYNLLVITEIMDADHLEMMEEYADILQVGARNMQNFSLLKKLGRSKCPIFLKRGMAATYQDLLMSAEYILEKGNPNVILCERGIRTFETFTRNTLDVASAPILKDLSHLPVILDPSHGIGIRKFIAPLCRASIAAGADGLMIEMHPNPEKALSDKAQTISPQMFIEIMEDIRRIAPIVGKKLNDSSHVLETTIVD